MNQTNATIKCDVARLNWPCRTWYARQLRSFCARFTGVPGDVTALFARIFIPGQTGHYDIPADCLPNSTEWVCYVIGTAFPTVGNAYYEIHATDARGNHTAIGRGALEVAPFSEVTTPVTPGAEVTVMQIADRTGALHTIKAVQDSDGNWTSIIDWEENS